MPLFDKSFPRRLRLGCLGATLSLMACTQQTQPPYEVREITRYPFAKTYDSTRVMQGHEVADPYFWLDDKSIPHTHRWIEEQRTLVNNYMEGISHYQDVRSRLTELFDYERIQDMKKVGDRIVYIIGRGVNDGREVYLQEGKDKPLELLFDPAIRSDGQQTGYLDHYNFDATSRYMAMVVHPGTQPTDEIMIWDLDTRKCIETLYGVKHTIPCWYDKGFFYGSYDYDGPGSYEQHAAQQIFYHEIGTPQSADRRILSYVDKPRDLQYTLRLFRQRFLFLISQDKRQNSAFSFIDLKEDEPTPHPVLDLSQRGGRIWPLGMVDSLLYFRSNALNPDGAIYSLDLNHRQPEQWTPLITPETGTAIYNASAISHHFFVTYLIQGTLETRVYDLQGNWLNTIAVPNYASPTFSGEMEQDDVTFVAASVAIPPELFSYDIEHNHCTLLREPEISHFNWKDDHGLLYVTERCMITSVDGVRIPLLITYPRHMKKNGNNPCLLVGHGAHGAVALPRFDVRRMLVLEQGGIFAQVGARGGGECGEEWHKAGCREQKNNTFDDFETAIRFLINNGYTSPNLLALQGSGEGGLAVAVTANRHPELFAVGGAVRAPLDMMHFHIMRNCNPKHIKEFGTAEESPAFYDCLSSYDPIVNLPDSGVFPAFICLTADNEEHISPAYSYKYMAALQSRHLGKTPHLLYIDWGNHTKTIRQQIEEYSCFFSFFWYNIRRPYIKPKL